ncbi:hypothetical protein [Arthrobacter celericrescens]|uniref:hypothetical protein n=1 Tax=Arthrobacter celericrescens TaxID=2320851 RepID=UPI000EA12DD7|nr:hypothetical protein [Arthrobacter celericrescens]
MTRPADVSPSYGPDGTAYLVQCGASSRGRLFYELKSALRYAQKHNTKHHRGAVAHVRERGDQQTEFGEKDN